MKKLPLIINSIYGIIGTYMLYAWFSSKMHPIVAYSFFIVIWGIYIWSLAGMDNE